MSLAPSSAGEQCSVSYHLEEGSCECIVGKVAVDDTCPSGPTRPVVFEVLGDDDGKRA